MYRSYKLTPKQVSEIHYLGTEGCPCCKVPLPAKLLSERYDVGVSTVSRIINDITRSEPLKATRKEKVELKKRVIDGTNT